MFCTACATANRETMPHCTRCGATLAHAPGVRSKRGRRGQRRGRGMILSPLLHIVPVVILVAAAGYGVTTYRDERASLAAAYDRAEAALASGDYTAAVAGFTQAGQYRDAEARRVQTLSDATPYRRAYLAGLDALSLGDFDEAIASLTLVVRDLPDYEDAAVLLDQARRLRTASLLDNLDDAEAHRDWLGAERVLATLLADDPENPELRDRLASIHQRHAPLVYTRAGAIFVAGPDLIDEQLVTDEVEAVWPVWSPDRTRIAFYSPTDPSTGRYGLFVVNLDGTDLKLVADDVRLEGWPIWSPDGGRIAFTSLEDFMFEGNHGISSIRVLDLATGDEEDFTADRFHYVTAPAWSPDGTRIAFVSKRVYNRGAAVGRRVEGSLHILDVRTGEIAEVAAHKLPFVDYVSWSPVADLLLVLSSELGSAWYETQITTIQLINVHTGEFENMTSRSQTVSYPFWSPDGSRYAFLEGSDVVQVRTVEGAITFVNIPRDAAPFLTWAPDGQSVLAPSVNPSAASMIIPVSGGSGTSDLALVYDYSAELAGPPQWSPRTPPVPAPTGSFSGTAMDR